MHKRDWVHVTYCHSHALQLVVGDTIKAIKIMRGSLGAAFELTKVIKCSMILKSYKKIKYSPKGASSRLRKDYAARIYNVERVLSLTVLVMGTSKISLTSLSTSDIISFWDPFNDEKFLLLLLF